MMRGCIQGATANSPRTICDNIPQILLRVPVNVNGNSVNIIGLLNPAFGNTAENS